MSAKEIRYDSIDIAKAVACIGVIYIHFGIQGHIGKAIQVIALCGIPFFYMVSGFFCKKAMPIEYYLKKIRHIGIITLFSTGLYLFYNIYENGFSRIVSEISIASLLKVVVFTSPQMSSGHLWFLYALIYCYLLFIVVERIRISPRLQKCYIVFALISHMIFIEILPRVGIDVFIHNHPLVRNPLLYAFPFFLLGNLFRGGVYKREHSFFYKVLILIGAVVAIVEYNVISVEDYQVLYIGNIIMVIGVFLLCMLIKPKRSNTWLAYIGRELSMPIYIMHPMIGHFVIKNTESIGQSWIFVITALSSVAFAIVYDIGTRSIQKRRKAMK